MLRVLPRVVLSRARPLRKVDITLAKNIRFSESVDFSCGAEAFNVFNITNYRLPVTIARNSADAGADHDLP